MSFGSYLEDLFGSTPSRTEQFQRFTPEQQEALSGLLQSGLGQAGQDVSFDPIEARARRQFKTETIPSLAERFTSLGEGGQRSSAFQSSLGRAGAGLEEGLAGLRSRFGQGQQQLGLQQLGLGLTPRFENVYFPRQAGIGEQALAGGIQGLTQLLHSYIGGGGL